MSSAFHTLTIDERTDTSVDKSLILYFKFSAKTSSVHRVSHAGILQLKAFDASAAESGTKRFYAKNNLDLQKKNGDVHVGCSVTEALPGKWCCSSTEARHTTLGVTELFSAPRRSGNLRCLEINLVVKDVDTLGLFTPIFPIFLQYIKIQKNCRSVRKRSFAI